MLVQSRPKKFNVDALSSREPGPTSLENAFDILTHFHDANRIRSLESALLPSPP